MFGLLVVAFFFVLLCVLLIAAGVQAITDTDLYRTPGEIIEYATTLWTIAIWAPIIAVAAAMKFLGYDRVFSRILAGIVRDGHGILRAALGAGKTHDRAERDSAAGHGG